MDYCKLKYGLFADAPDLVETIPALGKLKKSCPKYVDKALVFHMRYMQWGWIQALREYLERMSDLSFGWMIVIGRMYMESVINT